MTHHLAAAAPHEGRAAPPCQHTVAVARQAYGHVAMLQQAGACPGCSANVRTVKELMPDAYL